MLRKKIFVFSHFRVNLLLHLLGDGMYSVSAVYVLGCAYINVLFQSNCGYEIFSLIIPLLGYDCRRAQIALQALSLQPFGLHQLFQPIDLLIS